MRDWIWLAPLAMRGILELAKGRWQFAGLKAADIPERNRQVSQITADLTSTSEAQKGLIGRIMYAMPRIARRMPWRSDCLVQALAAQNWLAAHEIRSVIVIGVEKPGDGDFGAHAWLAHGQTIVTGGEIERYSVLLHGQDGD
ncbi:MAG: lasso peptide biosynthesis B2 protein [Pseudomonadota bacterium]